MTANRWAACADRVAGCLASLAGAADGATAPLEVEAWESPGEPAPPAAALRAARFAPVAVGDGWGTSWGTTWFRLRGTIPTAWAGSPVEAHVDLGYSPWPPGFQAEGLVVAPDGRPLRGMHPRQPRHVVTRAARGGEPVEVLLEAAANPGVTSFTAGGADDVNRTGAAAVYRLGRAELALPDLEARALADDLDVLRTLLVVGEQAGTPEPRLAEVAAACDDVVRTVAGGMPPDGSGRVDAAAVRAARRRLRPVLARSAAPGAPVLSLVGHAHLDTAWLWPVRETVRKAVRTYANVLALMDDDPDLTFAGTQAAHHAWLEERHPELFARVVERARGGRWVPVGGMWVESDVLLPSGESLARQLAHGQRYFLDRFGRAARTGWLPDCFGYSPALPQLLRAAGIDGFVTQKLSWNDTNRFPYRTFWWEGLDGSRVLAHFPAVNTYNAELSATDIAQALAPDPSGVIEPDSLAPLGYGDGGGGPTPQMLARARRMRDLDGLPRARFVDPEAFLDGRRHDDLPTWRGDLYLETHRGVWTSQRATKLGDARGDEALREAETWCATAALLAGAAYPDEELDALWRRHLLLEFHDILPGTSITRVHREAEDEHADVLAATLRLRDAALIALGGRDRPPEPAPMRPAATPDGGAVLDNDLVRVVVAPSGTVTSLVDLTTGRELVAPGRGMGVLHLHDDRPTVFDAWNLDRSYLDSVTTPAAAGLAVDADGVRVRYHLGGSTGTLTWSLQPGRAAVRLAVDLDWHERDRILKLALPVRARPEAVVVGVQHGHVARSLVDTSSWAQARYEDWFHGFLHLADDGDAVPAVDAAGGLSVVTADCHGYDATRDDEGTTLRLSLVRGPRFPDPECDLGRHRFEIDLRAGGDLDTTARAARAARAALVPAAADHGLDPLVDVDGRGVVVDAVKLADDGSGDVVVRVNACLGERAAALVRCRFPVAAAVRCDLLERPVADPLPLPADPGTQTPAGPQPTTLLPLRPFEVVTLRLRPAVSPRRAPWSE